MINAPDNFGFNDGGSGSFQIVLEKNIVARTIKKMITCIFHMGNNSSSEK